MTSSSAKTAQTTDLGFVVNTGEPAWEVYAAGVRLVALRALGNPALADDIAQEAVARAISMVAADRADAVADMGAFVYGIARHLIADVHRARDRTIPLDAIAEPAEVAIDALEAAIATEERQLVRAALAGLSVSDRNILRLTFFDGLNADEIARRLRDSAVNIRKRKSRALQRLRRAFLGGHAAGARTTE